MLNLERILFRRHQKRYLKKTSTKFDCFFHYWHTAKSIFCDARVNKISVIDKNSIKIVHIILYGTILQLHCIDYAIIYETIYLHHHFRSTVYSFV